MRRILTGDGSLTLYNDKFGESYHHISGAVNEAQKKYVEPCKIAELAKAGRASILDVCFGLGYNSCAAIDAALKANPNCKIRIVALEIDEEVLAEISGLTPNILNYGVIKAVAANKEYNKENINISLIMGDAKETIKRVDEMFDAVFLDPFSPKKCPELWAEEFFLDIRKKMKTGAVLSTYSSARIVKDNLAAAGFSIVIGPSIGRRAPITIGLNTKS
jgi:tRNA U34 5-methylaminomethyl-2-thiouridine-forming methyltransferase MnmC